MLDSIQLSTEAMNARIHQQEVIANNLANVNTIGFKKDRVFQEVLTEASENSESKVEEVTVFEQGPLRETKNPLDIALVGKGFFTLQSSEGRRYTRNGHFRLDASGQLVLEEGVVVMGENGPIEGRGEMHVDERGKVYFDGVFLDKLWIVTFNEPYPLRKTGNSQFVLTDESSPELEVEDVVVKQGSLEESNVNPVEEMVNMITVFRYFEADQKSLRAQDELLSRAVNDVGKVY